MSAQVNEVQIACEIESLCQAAVYQPVMGEIIRHLAVPLRVALLMALIEDITETIYGAVQHDDY